MATLKEMQAHINHSLDGIAADIKASNAYIAADIKEFNAYMNKGKGALAAIVFASASFGAVAVKILAFIFTKA